MGALSENLIGMVLPGEPWVGKSKEPVAVTAARGGRLRLFTHLQQRVDGSVLVSSLGFQDGTDHFPVHVGEHVLDGFQIFLAAAGWGAHTWRGHGHGDHARAADSRHSCDGHVANALLVHSWHQDHRLWRHHHGSWQ